MGVARGKGEKVKIRNIDTMRRETPGEKEERKEEGNRRSAGWLAGRLADKAGKAGRGWRKGRSGS